MMPDCSVVLICIFERGKLLDPNKSSFVNVFSILFEVVSGYVSPCPGIS